MFYDKFSKLFEPVSLLGEIYAEPKKIKKYHLVDFVEKKPAKGFK